MNLPFGDVAAALEHGLEFLQVLERGLWTIAFVETQCDLLLRDRARRLVLDTHARRQRRDLGVVPTLRLRLRGALLRLQGVRVLRFATHAVALGDDLRRFDHRRVHPGVVLALPRITDTVVVDALVHDQRDGLDATANGDRRAIDDDVSRGGGDRHQTRRTGAIDGHARHGDRQPRAQRGEARNVLTRRALLHGTPENDVLDFARVYAGTPHGLGNDVAAQGRGIGVIESTAAGPADRRARGGDDHCFPGHTHSRSYIESRN